MRPFYAFSLAASLALALPAGIAFAQTPAADFSVGPQYDTTHVYVPPQDFDRFVASVVATFGGSTSRQGEFQVTPTPSQTMSQLVLTPVGTLSVFGFKTPIPYPFGAERTGYLVTDMDAAVAAARQNGAAVTVSIFPDPIGRDAVIQWPGGVNMQLYWHVKAPHYGTLATVPENRVYVSPDQADDFVRSFTAFSHGKIVSDNSSAPGEEIGEPGGHFRLVRIESGFGRVAIYVTDGHLPYPYGREMTGYEVKDLHATLTKAQMAGVKLLAPPVDAGGRESAMLEFPGGYIAEIHQQRGQ